MIGLPHQPQSAGDQPPSSTSAAAVEGREGRIGNAFACERCRKHKVRCVPSDTQGLCQRCQKARVECIEHVARRRPAKPRSVAQTPNRSADMERKLDKLSAIVTVTSAPSSAPQPILPSLMSMPSQGTEITHGTPTPPPAVMATPVPPALKTSILPNPRSSPESAHSFWESINDTISGMGQLDPVLRSISVVHMDFLLNTYRNMVDFFPFVPLPKDRLSRDLIQQRPMLMFALLTTTSYDSPLLQFALSREFRKVAMVKIMNGEKSLDLLQGLLVFVAWHHHYSDPQAVSLHMLLQICIGISGDLGLENIPSGSAFRNEDPRDREAKRAYLGCYYLSSNLGMVETTRNRSLSQSVVLRTYATELASVREYKSDVTLPALIETCQFMEDVEETFRSQPEQALVVKSQVKRLSEKWDMLRMSSKQSAAESSQLSTAPEYVQHPTDQLSETLQWLQMNSRVHLYRSAMSVELLDRDSAPWASGFQLSLRITALRSIEHFLDNAVQLQTNQYEYLSIVDWLSLISTLTTLGKLALHSTPIPGWDSVDLQLAKIFEHFRDLLCSQLPRLQDCQDHKTEDVFDRFRRITAIMKMAMRAVPGRSSPNGSTFEITTSSRQTVSLLQDLPAIKQNGIGIGVELPAPWKVNPGFDMSSNDFPWKFLMGAL
ncbi:hypothetical protein BCR34DRAFT_587994 [Clohesyomyces aquaticus]|uniref:Zn(2)-C6 fungal-type domain-containing protein n=1 Tax=Clohesyomyces aquaticus TaxID=1231657 RepID=A0A1Y1ZMB5_9PLEO|nr:hypothetical protein BCR34DRAFT_587994 [Clohesyomyces aquaticus]